MAITEHYYILFQNPTRLDGRKLLTEYMFAKVGKLMHLWLASLLACRNSLQTG